MYGEKSARFLLRLCCKSVYNSHMNGDDVAKPGSSQDQKPDLEENQDSSANEQDQFYAPDEGSQQPAAFDAPQPDEAELTWQASEFVRHEKDANWYMAYVGVMIVVVTLVYFIARDVVSIVASVILAILLGVLAGRKPRVLTYTIDHDSITIDNQIFFFSQFRSFGVLQDGAFTSIVFTPLQRLRPPLTIYYPPEVETDIADVLSRHLPYSPVKKDALDHLLSKMRF